MRGPRKANAENWEFDGKTITVRIPMTFARRGGRKVIVAPDGGDAWAPARPRPDETLIRALARAHRWKRLLEEGRYRSAGEIAEAEGVTPQFRQPAAPADSAGAGHRRGDPRGTPAEGGAAGGSDASDVERMGGAETALLNRPPPHELRAEWVMSDH